MPIWEYVKVFFTPCKLATHASGALLKNRSRELLGSRLRSASKGWKQVGWKVSVAVSVRHFSYGGLRLPGPECPRRE